MRRLLAIMVAAAALWAGSGPLASWAGPGGLCLRCHEADREWSLGAFTWQGPVEVERITLCPGLEAIKLELYLTESRLVAAGDILAGLAAWGVEVDAPRRRLERLRGLYQAGLLMPVTSVAETRRDLQGLRERLEREVASPGRLRRAGLARALWLSLAGGLLLALAVAALWARGSLGVGRRRGGPA